MTESGEISPSSTRSLLLEMLSSGNHVATGTAFTVTRSGKSFLITNRHNVTGRDSCNHPISRTSVMPDTVQVHYNSPVMQPGAWIAVDEPLYLSPGEPRWMEHPTLGRQVDVVAIPIPERSDVLLVHWNQDSVINTEIAVNIASDLSIIGFPFGRTGGGRAGIWTRGTIASEPSIDFDDLPRFLVDARTRPGQSGSPVIFYNDGRSMPTKSGDSIVVNGRLSFLVGVYSGRLNSESDLGYAWKARVINEIIDGGWRPSGDSLMST